METNVYFSSLPIEFWQDAIDRWLERTVADGTLTIGDHVWVRKDGRVTTYFKGEPKND